MPKGDERFGEQYYDYKTTGEGPATEVCYTGANFRKKPIVGSGLQCLTPYDNAAEDAL